MSRQRQLYRHQLMFTSTCVITKEHYERLSPGHRKKYRQMAKKRGLPEIWTYSKSDIRSQEMNQQDYED